MNDNKWLFAAAGALAWFAASSAHAAAGSFSLTTGIDYSTGKYGGSTATDIWYVPLTGKYETERWALKLTVPYIRVTGPGNIVREVGTLRADGGTRTTQSGMGDVVAAATYNLSENRDMGTLIDLTGKVKFGTADDTKGLGTGQNDYSVQVDAYKTINRTTALGTLGYKIMGDPPGVDLSNVFFGSIGFSHKFSPETSGGLILDGRQKASPSGAPQRELTAYFVHKYSSAWKAQFYLVKGFADGSPDNGAGAMATYTF